MSADITKNTERQDAKLALSDVEFIRNVIETGDHRKPDRTELSMTALVFGASLALLACEQFFPTVSEDILESGRNPEMRKMILLNSGLVLALLGIGVYGLAWLRARELQSTMSRTLGRSFEFLKAETFIPDLLLKGFVLVTVLLTSHTEYVATLLVAFIADYVFQGRFFRMSRLVRLACGAAIYAVAAQMLVTGSHAATIPLALFTATTLASLVSVIVRRKSRHV